MQLCRLYLSTLPSSELLYCMTKCTMTCTCLEASQCAVQRSHEQFSGRQSHASFEDYIRICLSQLQHTHSGKKIQWNNLQKQTLKYHPVCYGFPAVLKTSSSQHYMANFCTHVNCFILSTWKQQVKKYGPFGRHERYSTTSSYLISVLSSAVLHPKQKPGIPTS